MTRTLKISSGDCDGGWMVIINTTIIEVMKKCRDANRGIGFYSGTDVQELNKV